MEKGSIRKVMKPIMVVDVKRGRPSEERKEKEKERKKKQGEREEVALKAIGTLSPRQAFNFVCRCAERLVTCRGDWPFCGDKPQAAWGKEW